MRNIADQLIAVGQDVSDDDLVLYILSGLSSEFEAIIVNITSRIGSVTLSEAQFTLQSHEMRLQQITSTQFAGNVPEISAPSANFSLQSSGNFVGQRQFGSGNFQSRGGNNYRGRGRGRLIMMLYRVFNLILAMVLILQNKCFLQAFSATMENRGGAYSAGAHNPTESTPLFLDSVANSHFTSDFSNLSIHSPYTGQNQLTSLFAAVSSTAQLWHAILGHAYPSIVSKQSFPHVPSHSMVTRFKHGILKPKIYIAHINSSKIIEPLSGSEALSHQHWKHAMNTEFNALLLNHTWDLVPYDSRMQLVDHKCVFRVKYRADGEVDSIAVSRSWEIQQVDINNAFLHGTLQETIYMTQPQGYVDSAFPNHVCKLNKTIYGLKQAPKSWNDTLKRSILAQGFKASASNSSFSYRKQAGKLLLVVVYVYDILLEGDDFSEVQQVILLLDKEFSLKNMGRVSYFLGLKAHYEPDGILLNQTKYILGLLQKTRMSQSKPCPCPYNSSKKLFLNDSAPFSNHTLYRSTVGAMQYLTMTRQDISYSVNKLSQFLHAPTINHWMAVKRVLLYLKSIPGLGLLFQSTPTVKLQAFSNADWASSVDDRRSTKLEYRDLASAIAEILLIKALLLELGYVADSSSVLWCDNIGAISLASNPVFHARTKHIEVDVHFIREKVHQQLIDIRHIASNDQLAGALTKPLVVARFQSLCSKFSLCNPRGLKAENRCDGEYVDTDMTNLRCVSALQVIEECLHGIDFYQIMDSACPETNRVKRDQTVSGDDDSSNIILPSSSSELGTKEDCIRCNESVAVNKDVLNSADYQLLLAKNGYRGLVYNGDHDMMVPYISTLKWIYSLNLTLDDN
ncbi:copia protein [Phtheirospermum japonicum]|uniref:Copia protein n=1 Tax=Phtheirospermum japonicum TaxID=374723 RepID=A0A830BP88_9LAMI|nr:copia protein [Phtheirospermum japonicum]